MQKRRPSRALLGNPCPLPEITRAQTRLLAKLITRWRLRRPTSRIMPAEANLITNSTSKCFTELHHKELGDFSSPWSRSPIHTSTALSRALYVSLEFACHPHPDTNHVPQPLFCLVPLGGASRIPTTCVSSAPVRDTIHVSRKSCHTLPPRSPGYTQYLFSRLIL